MRLVVLLCMFVAASALATNAELGNGRQYEKSNDHVLSNPGLPDTRQGGEDIYSALEITAIPFSDTGTTTGHINDYDSACPYTGSTSPDVVYSYTPDTDVILSIDLCGSLYDTKTYIMNTALDIIACNDDFYSEAPCGQYVSYIAGANLLSGQEYFIVIDGYGADSGEYSLEIDFFTPPDPCVLNIQDEEGEPQLVDGYVDEFNAGCNNEGSPDNFTLLYPINYGDMAFSGNAGWYVTDGLDLRDTDWFTATIGELGIVEWNLDAEEATLGFQLSAINCNDVSVLQTMTAGPCAPASMTILGSPGEIIWMWIGSEEFTPPIGFTGNEYNYQCDFTGLDYSCVPTTPTTIDKIKSLFR